LGNIREALIDSELSYNEEWILLCCENILAKQCVIDEQGASALVILRYRSASFIIGSGYLSGLIATIILLGEIGP